MKENRFQAELVREIKERFPGSVVLKNDPDYLQGVPDILVLNGNKWAALECKKDASAPKRPNQEYYVKKMDEMSFSRFIFPENKEEVMERMKEYFG